MIALVGYIIYDKFLTKEETKTNNAIEIQNEGSNNDITEVNIKKVEVPKSDLMAFYYDNTDINSVFYGYIDKGYLYYVNDNFNNKTNKKIATYESDVEGMTKYEKISNVKRIKVLNKDGQYPVIYLITEEGKVYYRKALFDGDFGDVPPFENYEVEDILIENRIN